MTIANYNRMIAHCIKQYEIDDPKACYVAIEWKDGELHPIFFTDCDRSAGESYIICAADETLNTSKYCGPVPVYPHRDSYRRESIIGTTYNLSLIQQMAFDPETTCSVKLLLTHTDLPRNVIGDINPHQTRFIRNSDGECILVFHWDYRDSGDGYSDDAEYTFRQYDSFYRKNVQALKERCDCCAANEPAENPKEGVVE